MAEDVKKANTVKLANTEKKKEGLSQLEINIIESRLTLSAGTLPQEIGGALANRFGVALEAINKQTTALSYLSNIKDVDARKKKTIETRKALEAAKLQRQQEVSHYTKLAMEYIIKTYGDESRNEHNRLTGYGDSIEVTKARHLRKVW